MPRVLQQSVLIAAAFVLLLPALARAQDDDDSGGGPSHDMSTGGQISKGIPRFCAEPTVTSVASGLWSNAATWSTKKVPAADDMVLIKSGHAITYDAVSDDALKCIDIEGHLGFKTDTTTRLKVGTLDVLAGGMLEVGTEQAPIAPAVRAEIVIADQDLDPLDDVEQFGTGLIGQGVVRMHGAPLQPTFIRLAAEPLKGQSTLTTEAAVNGWHAGDRLVIPDTRQLRATERGENYDPQWEELTIAAVAGTQITLTAPLMFDHKGARDGDGKLEFLPHVANLTRNVVVRSENPMGTRGHVIFNGRPDVDVRYVLFKDLGRTRPGPLDSAEYDKDGVPRNFGTNQIGRYSLHMHHVFGPERPQANGYQFTLIGNAVDGGSKWGITVHNSHYGLVRDNVVYDANGAAFVAEDGTESFNLFEHNFAMRSFGSGEFAPRSGYGGATADPGGEGAGFWLRGPNNILRDNVAANVDVFGFAIAAGSLGKVHVPSKKGADPSQAGEFVEVDTTDTPVLEFTGNEAYGALQTGVAIGWNATLKNTRVWHASRHGLTAFPVDRLSVEGFVARGDASVLSSPFESPTGIWFNNYGSKTVTIRDANIQGLRVGVASPFFAQIDTEPGRGDGLATIENSYLRDYVGLAVATAHVPSDPRQPTKKAIVRNSTFAPLGNVPVGQAMPAAISMNYGAASGDSEPRAPVIVYGFNGMTDAFRVYYSLGSPAAAPPCTATRPTIVGAVCEGDGAGQQTQR
jgi:hypothetical protein